MTRVALARSTAPRVDVIAPAKLGEVAVAALHARGIDARVATTALEIGAGAGEEILAWALEVSPSGAMAVELAAICARAATAGRPVCLLAPQARGTGRTAIERTAALAYLRAHGAAISHDVDAWLEAVVALVRFGLPRGPRAAVIAPPGSWLEAQAHALAAEAEQAGTRAIALGEPGRRPAEATDVVLYDPAVEPPAQALTALEIPVAGRAELAGEAPALFGLRAALAAIELLGRAAERIAIGVGPAPASASAELAIDRERLQRQLGKLPAGMRVGDHETKALLHAYKVPITRQRVAVTPSAAVKAAREATYPVEMKPWGHDLPTERAGCPVEKDLTSDALVRRAFASVLAAAGKLPTASETGAVIVRVAPPAGRDVVVQLVQLPALGWTVVLEAPGVPLAAAPAPLRLADAEALAAAVVSSRAGDPEPDRAGLADAMRRASHLVADLGDRLKTLELARVVVGGRAAKTVVADAWCELAP